jgi:hypothetical protein
MAHHHDDDDNDDDVYTPVAIRASPWAAIVDPLSLF